MAKFVVDETGPGVVTLRVPGMNYRNSFAIKGVGGVGDAGGAGKLTVGRAVNGVIHAPAWKVDRVEMGGNYVEPLFGRPRRMQGMILSVDAAKNELTVQVGYPVTVKLPAKYKAADYQVGQRVGWDNLEVPAFEVAS